MTLSDIVRALRSADGEREMMAGVGNGGTAARLLRSASGRSMLAGLVSQLVLVCSGPLVARMLGVSGRGELAFATVVTLICSQLLGAGLSTSVAYHLARGPAGARSRVLAHRRWWLWLVAAAGLASAAATFANPSTRDVGPVFFAAAGLLAMGLMLQQMSTAILQGERRFDEFNVLRVLPALCYAVFVLALFLLFRHVSVVAVLACSLASLALTLPVTSWRIRRVPAEPEAEVLPAGALLRYGLTALVGTAAPLSALSLDQALVGVLLSTHQLGLYVVAAAFGNLAPLLLTSIGAVAIPTLAAAGGAERARLLTRICLLGLAVGALATALLQLIIPWAVRTFFGAAFAPGISVARILSVAGLLLALRLLLSAVLQGCGEPRLPSIAEVLSLAVMFLLVPPLARADGLDGAALGLTLAAAFAVALLGVRVLRLRRLLASQPVVTPRPG